MSKLSLGEDHRVPKNKCIECGTKLNAASEVVVDGRVGRGPKEGDITICIKCGHLMAFNADLTLRELTDEEMEEVAGDARIIALQSARQATRR